MTDNLNHDEQQEQAPQQAQETPQARQVIVVDDGGSEYDPALDPGNPAFDLAKWKAAVDAAGGIDAMTDRLQQTATSTGDRITAAVAAALHGGRLTEIMDSNRNVLAALAPRIEELQKTTVEAMRSSLGALAPLAEFQRVMVESLQKTMTDLAPSLEAFKKARETFDEWLQATITDDLEQSRAIFDILTPYMDAEAEANPEIDDRPASELIAAAAARARADGKEIPPLRAEQPDAEPLDLEFPTEGTNKEKAPTETDETAHRVKRSEAEAGGALMTIGQRLLVPSDPDYQNAFISKVNGDIGIFVIDTLTGIQLRDNGAELSFVENGITDLLDANKRTGAKPLQDADTGFLRAMAKGAYLTRINSDSMTTSFYLPAFCDELGIEGTRDSGNRAEARKREVLDKIESLGNVWGKLPNSTQWWKVFSVIGYDPRKEIVTVAMPYFNQLLAAIERKQQRQLDAGKKYYIGYCDLLHAKAANERNQAAVELATRVLIGVQQRGGIPDKKLKQNRNKAIKSETLCTWKITCAGLIAECPQLQDKLNAQPTTGGRNKMMQRAFTSMYKILREKSDLFTYYKDVSISEVIPTSKTRTAEIIVKHHGLNPDYQKPVIILDAEPADQAE